MRSVFHATYVLLECDQEYEGVIDLHSGRRRAESSARRATTHSWPSPKDTPDRDLLKRPAGEDAAASERKFRTKCVVRATFFTELTEETAREGASAAWKMSDPVNTFFKRPPRPIIWVRDSVWWVV